MIIIQLEVYITYKTLTRILAESGTQEVVRGILQREFTAELQARRREEQAIRDRLDRAADLLHRVKRAVQEGMIKKDKEKKKKRKKENEGKGKVKEKVKKNRKERIKKRIEKKVMLNKKVQD